MKYQSELIKEIVEARGHEKSSLHYESECVETWIEEAKGGYPKLCDYESEWLNYISVLDDTGGEFPYVALSDVTEATIDNVVPYAYKSAVLKGLTNYIYQGVVQDAFPHIVKFVSGQYLNAETGQLNGGQDTHRYCEQYFEIPSGATTIIFKGYNNYKKLCLYDTDKKYIVGDGKANGGDSTSDIVRQIPSNARYFRFSTSRGTTRDERCYIYIDGVLVATTDENIKCELVSCKMPVLTTTGKNLFDKGKLEKGDLNPTTGENTPKDERCRTSDFIQVKGGSKITLSKSTNEWFRVFGYDNNKNFLSDVINKQSSSETFAIPSNVCFIKIKFDYTLDMAMVDNIQLEVGDKATSYEPYKSNILTTNEEVELRGIGDVKDTLDCLTGEVVERVGEIVLDGSDDENWLEVDRDENSVPFFQSIIKGRKGNDKLICDKLIVRKDIAGDKIAVSTTVYGIMGTASGPIRIKNGATSLTEFKQRLSQNPITVQYELATESIKTVELLAQNQDGKTLSVIKPIEGTMQLSTSSDTIKPLFSGEIPVEAITQNLASFIDLEMEE